MKRLVFLLSAFVLLGLFVPASTAQSREGFFIEPEMRMVWLLGDPVALVGLRLGSNGGAGFAYGAGLDVLIGSASSNPGPYLGNTVRSLWLASLALRYTSSLTERLSYDLGGSAVAVAFTDAMICNGTDVCLGGEPYLGIGPEVGVIFATGQQVSFRLGAGYIFTVFGGRLDPGGISLTIGMRFWP